MVLIGPDAGSRPSLEQLIAELGLGDRVSFAGPMTFEGVATMAADFDFFVQLSEQEGAAMSLIEAMQMGLVPVVTPVGEMGVHCRHLESGIVYSSEDQAAGDIARLLDDPALFAKLSAAAVDHWAAAKLYDEDFMDAARALASKGL